VTVNATVGTGPSYKKVGGQIKIGNTEIIGSFDDIYDFAYGSGANAQKGAMIQAGHATLISIDSGKVFFTRVNFDSGWSNEWNGDY